MPIFDYLLDTIWGLDQFTNF